jgi:uncharacterized protein YhfF
MSPMSKGISLSVTGYVGAAALLGALVRFELNIRIFAELTLMPRTGRGSGSQEVAVCRLAAMPMDDLPVVEFAFPGPLRDQLVAAILAGEKTTTTGLVADYEHENEPLPVPGLRQVVVDSASRPVAVIETTAVRVMRLADVDLDHALGEGEGFTSVAEWRAGHERFWHSAEMRQALGDHAFTVGDDTLVVASEFRLIRD